MALSVLDRRGHKGSQKPGPEILFIGGWGPVKVQPIPITSLFVPPLSPAALRSSQVKS